jgi:hypothetical protein
LASSTSAHERLTFAPVPAESNTRGRAHVQISQVEGTVARSDLRTRPSTTAMQFVAARVTAAHASKACRCFSFPRSASTCRPPSQRARQWSPKLPRPDARRSGHTGAMPQWSASRRPEVVLFAWLGARPRDVAKCALAMVRSTKAASPRFPRSHVISHRNGCVTSCGQHA